ncbi:hypothetical protein DSL72_007376 [Monilinia vaccinii-corymbosi]|uniref:Chromo domain-containing protein n=1 Tax=Monilinia vaccinii-corymbosi TaxID=61207 RepID=A0A8A3PMA0_9HELO|nr:hypothetical protein DSL72_007376 [Monilinia vaccinii-corymbosi]
MARRKVVGTVAKAQGAPKSVAVQTRGKAPEAPKPTECEKDEDEDEEWEVREILAIKKMWKNLWVRVAWVGFKEDLVWYPVADFKTCPHLLTDFYAENQNAPGPPTQLLAWLAAWEAGQQDYAHLKSNRPMDPRSRAKFFQDLMSEEEAQSNPAEKNPKFK